MLLEILVGLLILDTKLLLFLVLKLAPLDATVDRLVQEHEDVERRRSQIADFFRQVRA